MPTWEPNQPIQNGRFIIQKVLGGGGFGVTYSAIEYPMGKLVVIKTLKPQQQSQPDFNRRQLNFVNEGMRLATCNHPHIVRAREFIDENGLLGMVMEYVDGSDLAFYLKFRGKLKETEALTYIDQVGKALEYVHEQGLFHLDVKPNNILLRRGTKEAVLIDFGLAQEFTTGQIGNIASGGTVGYAPIEQHEKRGLLGDYTDVYALAATLYTLLTDIVPVQANFRKVEQLPPPKQYNSKISSHVNDAIVKGMALEPQDRPQTVREFRELLGVLTGATVTNVNEIKINSFNAPKVVTPVQSQPNIQPNINYAELESLLRASQWREADYKTYQLMLQAVNRQAFGWMRKEELHNFPCSILLYIDKLWKLYSNGIFGLTVQQQIWRDISISSQNLNIATFYTFSEEVGWRRNNEWLKYDKFTFNLEAQKGHLPSFGYGVQPFHEWQPSLQDFFPRISSCLSQ